MKSLLLATLLVAPLTTACLTETTDRYLRLGDADGALDVVGDDAWSYSGGATAVTAPGAIAYPRRVSVKVDIQRAVEERAYREAVAMGSIEVVAGSACRVTRAAVCDGDACLAELELTQPGVCMVRVRAATSDGEQLAQCWYRAAWEGDLADQAAVEALHDMAEQQRATCEDAL